MESIQNTAERVVLARAKCFTPAVDFRLATSRHAADKAMSQPRSGRAHTPQSIAEHSECETSSGASMALLVPRHEARLRRLRECRADR